MAEERTYIAIDLKSFYASVECAERHLDALTTNLVVADESRTEKTICLAVSPSLKIHGIPGRARLFEVVQTVEKINKERLRKAIHANKAVRNADGKYDFSSSSYDADTLMSDSSVKLDYIIARPRMQLYMDYSTRIYNIYLKYVSAEDIHVYSIDECFIDVTCYLKLYGMTAKELCTAMIREVLYSTGITATGGIGTNLYLAKVAMDIVAKHVAPDKDGVRIASLNEAEYRKQLWTHEPLTDFWHIGKGIASKLNKAGLYTMGDIAVCILSNSAFGEDILYKMFGVRAEILIDHAWGYEPTTIAQIKAYEPESNSISSGQVLHCPYSFEQARLIVKEMTDSLVLDLVSKNLMTNQIFLSISYDREGSEDYTGELSMDWYGRIAPKASHKSINLGQFTSSTRLIMEKTLELYDLITNRTLFVRRINITAANLKNASDYEQEEKPAQLDMFTDYEALEQEKATISCKGKEETTLQKTVIGLKGKYGKNAVLRGMNLLKDGTMRERNKEIGGHKA